MPPTPRPGARPSSTCIRRDRATSASGASPATWRAAWRRSRSPFQQPLADADDATKYLVHLEDALHDIAVQDDANLGGWLGQVLDRYGAGGRVVVLDKTDSQLPWEMFDYRPRGVPRRPGRGRALGAGPLPRASGTPASGRGEPDPGRMAAYVGQDEQAATRQGVPALNALAAALHASPDALTADLLASDGLSPIALAYLASGAPLVHGDEPAPARPGVRVRFNQAENRLRTGRCSS